MSTQTITQVENPVEFDDKLQALHEQAWKTQNRLDSLRDQMHRAVGDRKEYIGRRQYWRRTAAEVLQSLKMIADVADVAAPGPVALANARMATELLQGEGTLMTQLAGQLLAIRELDAIYARPENRWNRYFRCMNSDGHIHSSLRGCPSVQATTAMSWNTHLSGQSVEAAIADLGPTLCSICFAGAPAEQCQNRSDVTRAEREAAKAAREEAKFVKRLREGELFRCDSSWVETVAACLEVLRKEVEFRDYYGRGEHPFHREYWEAAHLARAVLIAREEAHEGTGRTAGQVDKAIASAVKKNRKDGARI